MASTEKTSTENDNIPSSSKMNDETKTSSSNDKDSGFECNVSYYYYLFFVHLIDLLKKFDICRFV
jgi:hypothetical protein